MNALGHPELFLVNRIKNFSGAARIKFFQQRYQKMMQADGVK